MVKLTSTELFVSSAQVALLEQATIDFFLLLCSFLVLSPPIATAESSNGSTRCNPKGYYHTMKEEEKTYSMFVCVDCDVEISQALYQSLKDLDDHKVVELIIWHEGNKVSHSNPSDRFRESVRRRNSLGDIRGSSIGLCSKRDVYIRDLVYRRAGAEVSR